MNSNDFLNVLLGIVMTVVFAQLSKFIRSYLPSQRMKELDNVLKETIAFMESAIADKLLPNPLVVKRFQSRMTR